MPEIFSSWFDTHVSFVLFCFVLGFFYFKRYILLQICAHYPLYDSRRESTFFSNCEHE